MDKKKLKELQTALNNSLAIIDEILNEDTARYFVAFWGNEFQSPYAFCQLNGEIFSTVYKDGRISTCVWDMKFVEDGINDGSMGELDAKTAKARLWRYFIHRDWDANSREAYVCINSQGSKTIMKDGDVCNFTCVSHVANFQSSKSLKEISPEQAQLRLDKPKE